MIKVYVNRIIEENGVTHGIIGLDKTVFENLRIIYSPSKREIINTLLTFHKEKDFYLLDRFCQFICYTQHQSFAGLSMKISDYHNDLDSALKEYSILREKDWRKEDTDKIMVLFQEIEKDNKELAEMIIKDPV